MPATKVKHEQKGYKKPKAFCTSKETINRVKRQPVECKILANHASDRELISKL
jgi:hypothetical protein